MQSEITSVTIANEIRMTMTQFGGAFILLEGSSDCSFFRKFIDRSVCLLQDCRGRDNVVDCLRILHKSAQVIGVVDRDYFFSTDSTPNLENLVTTDFGDLEGTVLASPALDRVVQVVGSVEKARSWVGRYGYRTYHDAVVERAAPLTALRTASRTSKLGLRFESINYKKVIDRHSLMVDPDRLLTAVLASTRSSSIDADGVRQAVLDVEQDPDFDTGAMLNGHDAVNLFCIALRNAWGSMKELYSGEDTIRSSLFLAFEYADLTRTGMYTSIRKLLQKIGVNPFVDREAT